MTTKRNDRNIDAIKARAKHYDDLIGRSFDANGEAHELAWDIPALVAEVERLRGLLSAVVDDITAEMNLARQAYRSTPTDHFAHDYCRWVGHAEAYSNALNFIDQNKEAH